MEQESIERSVAEIIAAVRQRGDDALIEFTERWDRVSLTRESLRVPDSVIAGVDTGNAFCAALERAVERIRRFHAEVKPRSVTFDDGEGARLGLRWTPIEAVGLYVPGGKASYPSTLAMTAVPAQIAGVGRIAVVSPPGPGGEVSLQVLEAARILGISEIYRVGGAQAVAALALGTGAIPRVDKIFGPGNAFVAEAKKQLFGEVGIDLLAGPSEVVVLADHTAAPEWVAADLMAQAEHDEATRTTLLATEAGVLAAVRRAISARIEQEPREAVISRSFERNGTFLVVDSLEEAAARINGIAPEHLSIQIEDPWGFLPRIRNAGAIFLGHDSPVAMGDYYAGPNHVLPTGGTARFASCLSVEDFMKRSNICQTTADFVRKHGENVEVLARGENLPAHGSSIHLRRRGEALGPREGFAAVEAYQLVEEEGEVKLNQNESPRDIPDEVKEEILREMQRENWHRYHQKVPGEFRAEIARAVALDPACVVPGNGSNLLLQWIFQAFAGPGRTVLIPAPSFSLYRMWGRLSESRVEEIRLVESAGEFAYPAAAMEAKIRLLRPALTVLCLPNNPTGSEMSPEALEGIVGAAEEVGGWVVIDEAYREFSDATLDRTGLVRAGRRVFLLRTFSKALAAAGLRIGYLLAPTAAAGAVEKIVPPFHLGLFNAVAGRVLWKHRPLFEKRLREIVEERERVTGLLAEVPGLQVFTSRANFFMVRVADAAMLHRELARRGILVRRLWKDPLLENSLRINIGTPGENDRLVAAVREILSTVRMDGGKRTKK